MVSSCSVPCLSELMQTEMHHIRTLRIMSEVYSKGLQKELQLELQTVEKLFPALDELLELHTQHLLRLLERKRESQLEAGSLDGGIIISRIGDLLLNQVRATAMPPPPLGVDDSPGKGLLTWGVPAQQQKGFPAQGFLPPT